MLRADVRSIEEQQPRRVSRAIGKETTYATAQGAPSLMGQAEATGLSWCCLCPRGYSGLGAEGMSVAVGGEPNGLETEIDPDSCSLSCHRGDAGGTLPTCSSWRLSNFRLFKKSNTL